jgi:hypothetical protein
MEDHSHVLGGGWITDAPNMLDLNNTINE